MKKIGLLIGLFCFFISSFCQHKSLSYFVSTAISKSPLLKDYKNQIKGSVIDSLRIDAGYKPQITASSSNTYSPTYKDWGYESAITNGANFSQLISVNKRLVSKENLQNQYQVINLQNQSIEISGKITEQDIKKAITAQYITAYGNQQQFQFNKEMLNLLP